MAKKRLRETWAVFFRLLADYESEGDTGKQVQNLRYSATLSLSPTLSPFLGPGPLRS